MNKFKLIDLPIAHVGFDLITHSGKVSQGKTLKSIIEHLGQPYEEHIVMVDNSVKSYIAGKILRVPSGDVKLRSEYSYVKLVYAHKLNRYSKDFISLVWL